MTLDDYTIERNKRIMKNWREALQDCQIPTGAVACMNATDFYIYTLECNANIIKEDGRIVHTTPLDSRIVEHKKKIDERYKQFQKDVRRAENDFYEDVGMFCLEDGNEQNSI